MFINYTITKKILEILIKKTYSKFGNVITSSVLDSLKLLGFFYATNAAISINIEDLKIPKLKTELINNTLLTNHIIKEQWKQGLLTELEKYQSTIDIWNNVTNILKNKIIYYYQTFDPVNNLYIMAFSGARGNISQVRQLVGMRGLMSDQDGKIIDLPILSNFREGLSLVDYIISAYGARKGIVDTALKTADSGYLTRRLIYGAQDLIIRITDCKSNAGIIILLQKNTDISNLIGRYCLLITSNKYPFFSLLKNEILLTSSILNKLKNLDNIYIKIRSIITCNGLKSICQKCYGWDLTSEHLISLGSAVGITAAQSIGEPGTQLTMRTFHTGGIFTGESIQQILSPFSGKILNLSSIKALDIRTNHGHNVSELLNKILLIIQNWKNIKKYIFLDKGSLVHIKKQPYIKQNGLIAEIAVQSLVSDKRKLKPLFTLMSGKCYIKNTLLYQNNYLLFTLKNTIFWIISETHYKLPLKIKYLLTQQLSNNKQFGHTKIISSINGLIKIQDNNIQIINSLTKIKINIITFNQVLRNYIKKCFIILKNYQYIDQYTIIGFLYYFSKINSKIYKLQQKAFKNTKLISFISNKNTTIFNSEQITNYLYKVNSTNIIYNTKIFNTTSLYNYSGIIYKNNGYTQLIQNAIPNFLNKGTILYYNTNNSINKNQNFALLLNYIQQTEDIVQGLPKIEELIEAHIPKKQCHLAQKSGIYLQNSNIQEIKINSLHNTTINYLNIINNSNKVSQIQYSNFFNKNIFNYNKILFNYKYFYIIIKPLLIKSNKDYNYLINTSIQNFTNNLKINIWDKYKYISNKNSLQNYTKVYNFNYPSFNIIYKNNQNNTILLKTQKLNQYIYLKNNQILNNFLVNFNIYNSYNSGAYIDFSEILTDGHINIHNLLNILYFYHYKLDDIILSGIKSLNKFQIILINSLQAIYTSQGVNISSKHIEIIINQLTTRVIIYQKGNTPFFNGEIINITLLIEILKVLKNNNKNKSNLLQLPKYLPKIQAITQSAFTKDGFLSAAGFQSTRNTLVKAAIEGSSDWLRGLKETIICGKLIPSGTSFLNYKNYLDTIYTFKL